MGLTGTTQPPKFDTVVHLIDALGIGGRQMLLHTVLEETLRDSTAQHRVVSLFGDGPMGDRYRALGVPVDIVDLRPDLRRHRYDLAARKLKRYFELHRPDIVEGHLTYSRLIGLFAAWRAGVPVRVAFEPGDIYLRSWPFRIANFAGQFLAQRIVPCSHALADWNHRVHGIQRQRMSVIHNCVNLDRFNPACVPVDVEPFTRPACETLFCAIGTLGVGVNKRVDVLIRGVAAAREAGNDVGLVIVGDGPLRPELEMLVETLGLGHNVVFLGARTDTPEILMRCDALCHAAPFEPFGIVALEAMAMALPVIVPDAGGIVEAIQPGGTGLTYSPLDHQALSEQMAQLHRNVERRREMGQMARRSVEERFSPASYVSKVRCLYRDIMGGAGESS